MSTWKRWSWRYRIGVLVALALLLQGNTCPMWGRTFNPNDPTYSVPGVGEVFRVPDIFDGGTVYVIKEIDPDTGRYRRIFPGDPRYGVISAYIVSLLRDSSGPPDRSNIPGGAGAAPPPPVQ